MKNFSEFRVEKSYEEAIKGISDRYGIDEKKARFVVDELMKKNINTDQINEQQPIVDSIIRLMRLHDEPKGYKALRKEEHEKNKEFLLKFIEEKKKKSEEIDRRFKSIFENFVKPVNGKCPRGYVYSKKVGGCVPKGEVLFDMSAPAVGKVGFDG